MSSNLLILVCTVTSPGEQAATALFQVRSWAPAGRWVGASTVGQGALLGHAL